MSMNQDELVRFFESIGRYSAGYIDGQFRFLAGKRERKELILLRGRLILQAEPLASLPEPFESERLVAGSINLPQPIAESAFEFSKMIMSGGLATPKGTLTFPVDDPYTTDTNFTALHPEGLQGQSRLAVFQAYAGTHGAFTSQPDADWDVMASPSPYNGLQELLSEFGLGHFTDHRGIFEVVALKAVAVDKQSHVSATTAHLGILASPTLARDRVSLSFRIQSPGKPVQRGSVGSSGMAWSTKAGLPLGQFAVEVPEASVLQCFASYDGQVHDFWWVADPATSQNPKRAIYELNDEGLAVLQDFLTKPAGKGNARDLESGVAWLMWMLGFSVAHLGGTAKTQDAADIVATTPSGHVGVIECTTGLLKADNKLALLMSRVAQFRERLAKAGANHLRVLAVIATSRPRVEVIADIEQAERLGILVLTKEDLLQAIPRTLLQPDPEAIYREAEESARAAQQRALGPKEAAAGQLTFRS